MEELLVRFHNRFEQRVLNDNDILQGPRVKLLERKREQGGALREGEQYSIVQRYNFFFGIHK